MMSGHRKNRKENTCSVCGNPSRGHIGPQGKKGCNMMSREELGSVTATTPLKVSSIRQSPVAAVNARSSPIVPQAESRSDAMIMELVNQVGQLSLTVQTLVTDVNQQMSSRRPGRRVQVCAPLRDQLRLCSHHCR